MHHHLFLVTRAWVALLALGASSLVAQGQPPRPASDGKTPEKSPLKKTSDVSYEMGGVEFNSSSREIRIPCAVNMTEGVIEYALVADTGKTHESLLKTKVKPFDVQVALLLCHYEPHAGELIKILSNPQPEQQALASKKMENPGANHVRMTLEWRGKDGKSHTSSMDALIRSKRDDKPLTIPHWIFNGADMGDGVFSANLDGSFIAVHFDLGTLIGSPAKWVGADDNWELDTQKIPPVDSAVTLVITPSDDNKVKK